VRSTPYPRRQALPPRAREGLKTPRGSNKLGRDGVSEDVDGGTTHIHERVDAGDQRDRLDRQPDRGPDLFPPPGLP
jgi:hypothetical protein